MNEEETPQSLRFSDLSWRKVESFTDEFADVVSVRASGRGIILDFGSFDYEEVKDGDPVDPHLNLHTRVRVSQNHFKDIAKLFEDFVSESGGNVTGQQEE